MSIYTLKLEIAHSWPGKSAAISEVTKLSTHVSRSFTAGQGWVSRMPCPMLTHMGTSETIHLATPKAFWILKIDETKF